MSDSSLKVLLVEDNKDLARNLFEFLEEQPYTLDYAADGLTALHLLTTQHYDVVVLDIMLPGVSGLQICQRIRQELQLSTPVLLITALGELDDKSQGFAAGADDYLVKPFDLRELKMRIDALSKRLHRSEQTLEVAGLSFNPGTLELRDLDSGQSLELHGTPARFLEKLMRAYPSYVGYEELGMAVRGEDASPHSIRTHIYLLRKALREALGETLIKTVHSRGYRLSREP